MGRYVTNFITEEKSQIFYYRSTLHSIKLFDTKNCKGDWVKVLNSGSVINIEMGRKVAHHCIVGPWAAKQPSVYNGMKGRTAAHQLVMRPKAAKLLIIV